MSTHRWSTCPLPIRALGPWESLSRRPCACFQAFPRQGLWVHTRAGQVAERDPRSQGRKGGHRLTHKPGISGLETVLHRRPRHTNVKSNQPLAWEYVCSVVRRVTHQDGSASEGGQEQHKTGSCRGQNGMSENRGGSQVLVMSTGKNDSKLYLEKSIFKKKKPS